MRTVLLCSHCLHSLKGHTTPVPLIGDTGWGCATAGCACVVDNPASPAHQRVAEWHPTNAQVDHLAECRPCQVRVARLLERIAAEQRPEPSPVLLVGDLRRIIDGLDDNCRVAIDVRSAETNTVIERVARHAWVQASDAWPVEAGGTDPVTEATIGVLIIQSWADDKVGDRVCQHCDLMLSWDPVGQVWAHADGHDYRHPAMPRREQFKLAPWVTVDTVTDDDDWFEWSTPPPSGRESWFRRRFGRTE